MRIASFSSASLVIVALLTAAAAPLGAAPFPALRAAVLAHAPAIQLAANSVDASRALRQSKHKWTKREMRKGYWTECGYDGYCTTIYAGSR